MTEKLYWYDSYLYEFDANVISCEKKDDNYIIVLDKTAFFPEGGGQPCDTGFINNNEVIDVQITDEIIYHTCKGPAAGTVHCLINKEKRFDYMQQHTGEQIFTGFVHKLKGYDNVGFHIGETETTIDFNGPLSKEEIEYVEYQANNAIYENIPIEIFYPSADELPNYDYRSKKELTGQVRLVKIGDIDLCACCGTHTKTTGEIGIIKVVYAMNYKGGVRLTIKNGKRAFEDYMSKHNNNALISASLCSKPEETPVAVEKLKEKHAALRYESNGIKKELYSLKCEHIDLERPFLIDNSGDNETARVIADMLADKVPVAYAFSGNDNDGYKYAIVSRSEDVREKAKAINTSLNGRGGGKPEIAMGSLKCTESEIVDYFKK